MRRDGSGSTMAALGAALCAAVWLAGCGGAHGGAAKDGDAGAGGGAPAVDGAAGGAGGAVETGADRGPGGADGGGNDGSAGTDGGGGGGTDGGVDARDGGSDARDGGSEAGARDGSTSSSLVGANGGTVSDPGGNITLTILPGWLLGDTRFTFTPLDSVAGLPADYELVPGTAWQIDWTGAGFWSSRFAEVAILPRTLASGPTSEPPGLLVGACGYDWVCYSYSSDDCAYLPRPCGGAGGDSPGPGSAHVAHVQPTPQAVHPAITADPQDLTVAAGSVVSFSVTATNAPNLQWLLNGDPIPGATGPAYREDAAQVAENGLSFSVVASDGTTRRYSRSALLTVTGPDAPAWAPSTPAGSFAAGIGPPTVGVFAANNTFSFAVWNAGGVLHSDHEGQGTWVDALPRSARGRPQVVSALLNFTGFIVFISDDGTSSCTGSTGNLLVALAFGAERHTLGGLPLSPPMTLYRSGSDCIDSFSADAISGKSPILPSSNAGLVGVVYALTEVGARQIKVGVAGAGYDAPTSGGGPWTLSPGMTMTLPVFAPCNGPTRYAPSLAGDMQTGLPGLESQADRDPASPLATLAWVATQGGGDVLCASTLAGTTWGPAVQVFAPVAGPPNVAMRATGDAAVVASKQRSAGGAVSYSTTAAVLPAAGGTWQVQELAADDQPATPFASFSAGGSLFAIWTRTTGAALAVNVAQGTTDGTWGPATVLTDAAATSAGYARIYPDDVGNAIALYGQTLAGAPMKIWSKRFAGGAWSAASRVQDSGNEGTFVDCQRYQTGSAYTIANFATASPFAAWRETDPNDPTRFRIVTSD